MDLQEALRGLDRAADDTVGGVVPPQAGDLWRRGERWQRRRRRGTAAVAALGVVVLAALSLVTVQRATPPEPAVSPGSAPTLPDRVYGMPARAAVGRPGEPVVAVELTTRSTWTGVRNAIAVITGSGRYLYLDVDGDLADRVALSPDGRRVAYWLVGTPDGTPRTRGGRLQSVTEVAVVDVVTGKVLRHRFATAHGLVPQALLWADDTTLLGSQSQWVAGDDGSSLEQGSADDYAAWQWRPGEGDVGALDPRTFERLDSSSEAAGGRVLLGRNVIDLATGEHHRVRRTGYPGAAGAVGSSAALRADGTFVQVGGPGHGHRVPNRVTVGDIDDASADQVDVPGLRRAWQVLGWRDQDRVVVVRSDPSASATHDRLQTVAIDVRTGDAEALAEGGTEMLEWAWATDLLGAPVVPGVEPASPADPRVVAGAAGTVVVLTLGGLVLWRRRGHP